MNFKKFAIGLSLAGLLLSGCSSTKKESSENKVKQVGILQLVQHPSLDRSNKGFRKALKDAGYVEGKNLKINYQNAQGNQDNLKSMSEKLVKDKCDLILGIATPAAQSLASSTQEIPIVATAVTDLKAAKLVKSYEKPDTNVTGTAAMAPVEKQIKLLLSIVPKAKKIGVMYDAGETNSKIQVDIALKALEKAGVEAVVKTANSTNDVQQVTETLANSTDGIYVPTDNTFSSAAEVSGKIVKEKKFH